MEDHKPNSPIKNTEGLGFFIFKIIEFILLGNALAASSSFVETAGKKHGRGGTFNWL
jgi:hypothetical protein